MRKKLINYALSLGADYHDAEDAVQDAYVALHKYGLAENPFGFLKQAVGWKIKKSFRRKKPGPLMVDPIKPFNPFPDQTKLLPILLHRLTAKEKAVIHAARKGLTGEETARLLNAPVGTISTWKTRAIKKMQRMVQKNQRG